MPRALTAVTAGHHIARSHQVDRLVEARPERAELPGFLDIHHRIDGLVDLFAGHVPLVAVFEVTACFERHRDVDDPDGRLILQRRLSLEFGTEEVCPTLDRTPS